uniref:40S ribosomal protein S7 n=1 Tax=Xiphophorus couchianus TaxID=32473 RepID=A0A3B5KL75_9TELE
MMMSSAGSRVIGQNSGFKCSRTFSDSKIVFPTWTPGGVAFSSVLVANGSAALSRDVQSRSTMSDSKLRPRLPSEFVTFINECTIKKMTEKQTSSHPPSRTLTSVHDAILEDLVFPSEIVGKRIRVKLDSSRLIKVHLDKAQQNNVEHKVKKLDFQIHKDVFKLVPDN